MWCGKNVNPQKPKEQILSSSSSIRIQTTHEWNEWKIYAKPKRTENNYANFENVFFCSVPKL